MKKIFHFLLLILISTLWACKKENNEPTPQPPTPPNQPKDTSYATKDIQIVFPVNSGIDPTTCTVFSYSKESPIDAQGKSKVVYSKGSPTITYVFNKDNQLLLAGFVSDTSATINTASTAKVLLYFAYQVPLQPYKITEQFVNRVQEIPGVAAWYDEFSTLFAANPLTIAQGTFVEPLTKKMQELTKSTSIDINAKKAADITVKDGNVRSGLQVAPEGLSKFVINQFYRRRAHAFLYKKSYTDLNGKITNIPNYDANGQEFKIDPVSGVTSLSGEAGKAIEGKFNESASVVSGPFDMQLEDNEKNATYILRIVGPGFGGTNAEPKTKPETDQLSQLELETFAIDILLPIIMEIAGNKDALAKNGIKIGEGPVETFIDNAEVFIKAFPDVYDEMQKGNYRGAMLKGVAVLWSNQGAKYFKDLLLAASAVMYEIAQSSSTKVPKLTFNEIAGAIDRYNAILKAVDLILLSGDFVRITANITSSRQMEEWELLARGANVTLLPKEKTLVPFEQLKLSAIIKNFVAPDGTHPYFEWKTTGRYGKLTDTKGHTNLVSFESPDQDVFYVSRVSNSSLSDGDNIDYVFVTAYYGNTKVGADTVMVNVQKEKYDITPEGITVSGKEKSKSRLTLYLEKSKGYNSIKENDSIDYKVVWTVGGTYGKLSSKQTLNQNSVTVYNNNSVIYECLDETTKEGIENVQAKMYRKRKTEPETEYMLFDDANGTVKINNDRKVKTFIVDVTYTTKILTPSVGNWAAFPTVKFAVDTNAKKYSVRLFHFTGTFASPPENKVYAWDAGKLPPTPYNIYPETLDIKDGLYYMVFGRTWCGGPCDAGVTDTWIANYKKGYGSPKAEVTIFLK